MKNLSLTGQYGYIWMALILFLISLSGHHLFGWWAFVDETIIQNQTPEISDYFIKMLGDNLKNWQSEFLKLAWQVASLAYLLYIGSPQSKENNESKETKLDVLFEKMG